MCFKYTSGGLKIRPGKKSDHANIVTSLKDSGVEFYTFNPNREQQIRYVLRCLPLGTDNNKLMAGLREKDIVVSNADQEERHNRRRPHCYLPSTLGNNDPQDRVKHLQP